MDKAVSRCSCAVWVIFLAIVAILAVAAFCFCFVYPVGIVGGYKLDTSLASSHYQLASGAVVLLFFIVIYSFRNQLLCFLDASSTIGLRIIAAGAVMLVGAVWVVAIANTPPIADELFCLKMAKAFMAGSLGGSDAASVAEYYAMYPYQAGFSLWICAWGVLFGVDNYLAIRLLNVFCVAITVVIVARISYVLFESRLVEKIALLLLAAFLPLVLLSDFFYGYIPSVAFGFGAICVLLVLLESTDGSRLTYAALLFFLLLMSVWLKANSMIISIAIIIVLWAKSFQSKSWTMAVLGICLIGGLLLLKDLPATIMAQRIEGLRMQPMPSLAWIAMGLQDGPRLEGGYNGYNVELYRECGGDSGAITQRALENIRERSLFFFNHPTEALSFFGLKILKEWCDPSFQAIVYSFKGLVEYPDWTMGSVAESFYDGSLRKATTLWCDVHQTLVYLLAVLGIAASRHILKRPENLVMPLVFLGGFFCFVVWEGKSIAVLPYYICLFPFAAYGASWLLHLPRERANCLRLKPKQLLKCAMWKRRPISYNEG